MDSYLDLENHIVRLCIIALGTLSIAVPLFLLTARSLANALRRRRSLSPHLSEHHLIDDMGHSVRHSGDHAKRGPSSQSREMRFTRSQQRLQRWILVLGMLFMAAETCFYALIPELPRPIPSSRTADGALYDAYDPPSTKGGRDWWQWNAEIVLHFWLPIFLPKLLNIVVMSCLYTAIGTWFAKTFFHTKQQQFLERYAREEGKSSMFIPTEGGNTAAAAVDYDEYADNDEFFNADNDRSGAIEDDASSVSSVTMQSYYNSGDTGRPPFKVRFVGMLKSCSIFTYVAFNMLLTLVLLASSLALHYLLYIYEGARLLYIGLAVGFVTFSVLLITTTFTIVVTHMTRSIAFDHYTSIVVRRVRRVWFLFVFIFVTYAGLFSLWLARVPVVSCMRLRFPFQTPLSNEDCMDFGEDQTHAFFGFHITGSVDNRLTAETLLWFFFYQIAPVWLVIHCFRPTAPQNMDRLHLIKLPDYDYNRSIEWQVSDEQPLDASSSSVSSSSYPREQYNTDSSQESLMYQQHEVNMMERSALSQKSSGQLRNPETSPPQNKSQPHGSRTPVGQFLRNNTFNKNLLSVVEDPIALGSPTEYQQRRKKKRRAKRRSESVTGLTPRAQQSSDSVTMYDISIS